MTRQTVLFTDAREMYELRFISDWLFLFTPSLFSRTLLNIYFIYLFIYCCYSGLCVHQREEERGGGKREKEAALPGGGGEGGEGEARWSSISCSEDVEVGSPGSIALS